MIWSKINFVGNEDFKGWLWAKFLDWRGDTINGPTAYARFLGVKQQQLSAWMAGQYLPRGENIAKLAEHYPDVYDALGLPPPNLSDFERRAALAVQEVVDELFRLGITDITTPEAKTILASVLARHGLKSATHD